jgi:hypothetical protein
MCTACSVIHAASILAAYCHHLWLVPRVSSKPHNGRSLVPWANNHNLLAYREAISWPQIEYCLTSLII